MVKGIYAGNLTADPRIFDNNGRSATQFTIGCRTSHKDRTSDQYVSNFVSVTVFGVQADSCAKLKKGEKVVVVGDQCVSQYTTRDGRQGVNIDVRADSVEFMPRPQNDARPVAASQPGNINTVVSPNADDELPF